MIDHCRQAIAQFVVNKTVASGCAVYVALGHSARVRMRFTI